MISTFPQIAILLADALTVHQLGRPIGSRSGDKETFLSRIARCENERDIASVIRESFGNTPVEEGSSNDRGIVFLHIMKTAGTSFFESLQKAFDSPGIWVNYDALTVLPSEVVERAVLVAGHFPYEARKVIAGQKKYLTILRDPRERALSHFHEVESIIAAEPEGIAPSIEEFFWDERWSALASNYQTRQLGFEIDIETLGNSWSATDEFAKLGPPFPMTHPYPLSSLFDSKKINDWDKCFTSAVNAISEIDIVLTTELIENARQLISSHVGMDFGEVPHRNSKS